jgi:glycosyltransferase involved in cell wall biosynthesis
MNPKSKIVIISPFQLRLFRGIERFSYSIALAFANRGYSVVLYCWSSNQLISNELDKNIKYRVMPCFRYFEALFAALFYKCWLSFDRPSHILLNFLYHGEQFLPSQNNYLYVLNSPASQIPIRYEFIRNRMGRYLNLKFFAVSEMVSREAKSYLNQSNIPIIPNGVDTSYFVPKSKMKEKPTVYKFISLAAFEERKGIQFAINALAKRWPEDLGPFEYHIFGDGPYRQNLVHCIHDCGAQNKVFIHNSKADIIEELQAADLFILLSKGEAFALAPLEAMACGVPILVSKEEPYPEFVKDSFGRMVNRENEEEIIKAILDILNNHKQFSQEARKASLDYDWSVIADRYLEIIES